MASTSKASVRCHWTKNTAPRPARNTSTAPTPQRRRTRRRATAARSAARAALLSPRKRRAGANAAWGSAWGSARGSISRSIWYCAAQAASGCWRACHCSANSSSGSRHRPLRPCACRAAASPRRRSCWAASASSAAHVFRRSQTRIRLSCEMSITVSANSGSGIGGIRNERLGSRKMSITARNSSGVPCATAHRLARRAGRRTPRGSVAWSVKALKSRSQSVRSGSLRSCAQASSACRSRAWAIVPMAS